MKASVERLIINTAPVVGFMNAAYLTFRNGAEYDSFPDGKIYLIQAEKIYQNEQIIANEYSDGLPQGVPTILALTRLLTGSESLLTFKVMLCLVFAATIYVGQRLLITLRVSKAWTAVAGFVLSVDPFTLSFVTGIQSEIFVSFFAVTVVYLLQDMKNEMKLRSVLLMSALFTVIITMRTNFLVIFVATLFYLCFNYRKVKGKALSIFIFGLVTMIMLTIFYIWVSDRTRDSITLSSNGGANLWLSCEPRLTQQIIGLTDSGRIDAFAKNPYDELILIKRNLIVEGKAVTALELDRELRKIAIEKCLENPFMTVKIYSLKFIAFARPFVNLGTYPLTVFLLSLALWLLMLLAFLKVFMKFRAETDLRRFLSSSIMLGISLNLSLLPSAFQLRHRTAAFEVLGWIFIFLFISRLHSKSVAKKRI